MTLHPCRSCGHMIHHSAKRCPNCGATLRWSDGTWRGIFGIITLLFVLWGYSDFRKQEEEKAAAARHEEAVRADKIKLWRTGENFPVYDVDKECSIKNETNKDFNECVSHEQEAYQKAKISWIETTPEIRERCAESTSQSGLLGRSYSTLVLCIGWKDMWKKMDDDRKAEDAKIRRDQFHR